MGKKDSLQRFIFENAPVRGEIVYLQQSFETIVSQHQYPPLIRELLGEALVAAVLLSATIKFKGRLTIQIQGKGQLKLLLAQCNDEFHVRGLVQWQGDLTAGELLGALKSSVLVINIQPDDGGKSYQGVVGWQGDSIARSIEGYFRHSEQLATRIWIAVDKDQAAGLLLQVMPGADKSKHGIEDVSHAAQSWDDLIHLTETLTPSELLHLDNEVLLRRLYTHDNQVRLFESDPVLFHCNCSVKRSENAILLLGREEAEAELKDKHKLVVTCDFCSKEYVFDRVDVEGIFRNSDGSSAQMH